MPGPYGFLIHLVPIMRCSGILHVLDLGKAHPRASLCPLLKISILLALFHSFETSDAVFASSNAITNGSEV